uniref:Embryonic-1 n=1 Tax=Hydra vulgaris TaxID=6087 RepID=Q5EK49_HYDVU|nr:embryonic-1 [Hydra vulgaris]
MLKTFVLLLCVGISSAEFVTATKCGFKVRKPEFLRYCISPGSRMYIGDFDGDKHDDVMCIDLVSGDMSIILSKVSTIRKKVFYNMEACIGAKYVLLGDFNGDHRTDIICQLHNGEKYIYLATLNGSFSTYTMLNAVTYSTPSVKTFCTQSNYRPVIGDFDGDKFDDYMCHETTTGRMSIIYGQKNVADLFREESMLKDTFMCRGKILTGLFNGDKMCDIMCHDKTYGTIVIASVKDDHVNIMYNSTWKCIERSSSVMFADVDGDSYDDLLCKQTGKVLQILRNTRNKMFYGPVEAEFYPEANPNKIYYTVETGDFNGDGKDDLLGHGFDGSLQIAEALCLKL